MLARWWLLFRSLAVPTVLFFAPVLVSQQLRGLSYFLSPGGAVAELALDLTAFVLLQVVCAACLAFILSTGRALGLCSERADAISAGLFALLSIGFALYALMSPLDSMVGPIANASIEATVALAAVIALSFFGWGRAFALLNNLNRSAQRVLTICPLLLVGVLGGAFGWRSYDAIPSARSVAGDPPRQPNVVLISFDALAAQDMSLYGYRLPTTPEFERLARRSYNFINFYSSSDFTTPAVASLLTGQYPLTNHVFQLYGHIPHRMRSQNIAWLLRERGYTTAAIVTNPAAHPLVLRIADSFTSLPAPPISPWFAAGTYLMQLRNSLLFDIANGLAVNALRNFGWLFGRFNRAPWVAPRPVFDAAREFIRGAHQPYFLWIHLFPPHAPYVTDARFRGRFAAGLAYTTQVQYLWKAVGPSYPASMQDEIDQLRLRYDESIAECDGELGEFLNWMGTSGRDANAIVVVTSDHGENFANGWWTHESPDLHYAETHIPLLISLPGQRHGYVVKEDGDLTDVAPTLLALLGIAQPSWMDGHPLIGSTGAAAAPQPAFSMYLAQSDAFERPAVGAIAASSGPWHLVWHFPSGRAELFDIARDPQETHGTSVLRPAGLTKALTAEIRRRFGGALNLASPVNRR
ncbi:MAG TPA: sulfatase [Candidatus Binataceae bacterium]|nr:sulfatase [Candidatus Binataceae bacterium]